MRAGETETIGWHHCEELLRAGATVAISETLEASLQLGGAVLGTMGILEEDANQLVESLRKEYYEDDVT